MENSSLDGIRQQLHRHAVGKTRLPHAPIRSKTTFVIRHELAIRLGESTFAAAQATSEKP
jgi:hypothetical protein